MSHIEKISQRGLSFSDFSSIAATSGIESYLDDSVIPAMVFPFYSLNFSPSVTFRNRMRMPLDVCFGTCSVLDMRRGAGAGCTAQVAESNK